jgi:hypothetical protein
MDNIPSILDTAKFRHLVLNKISKISNSTQGFQIPEYDELAINYYDSTNNISSVVYKKSSIVVATLTLTYSVQPPISNDSNLVKVSIS